MQLRMRMITFCLKVTKSDINSTSDKYYVRIPSSAHNYNRYTAMQVHKKHLQCAIGLAGKAQKSVESELHITPSQNVIHMHIFLHRPIYK